MSKPTIYKRKDGRYEGRIYTDTPINGNRQYKSYYGKTIDEVKSKMIVSEVNEGIEDSTITITQLAKEWLHIMSKRIKDSTLANYHMKVIKHIIPELGDRRFSSITRKDIYSFIDNKINEGLSIRYVTDIIVLFKSIVKYANTEYNLKNIIEGIIMPKNRKNEVRILSEKEQNILVDHINNNSNHTTLGVAVSLYTGLRIGELCALKWSDIDLKKRILTVNRTIQRIQSFDGGKKTKVIITEPKSESSKRSIPIPDHLVKMLSKFKDNNEHYVMTGGINPLEPRNMQYRFAKLLKNVNLPSVHFHSLRHAFATKAVELGFDIKTLSEILGHSTVELTLNRYVHSSFDRKRMCMDLFTISV